MRALVAAALALSLAVTAMAPHVHGAPHAPDDCAVCVVRNADVPHDALPELAPADVPAGEVALALPAVPPVTGAPQGAIPGQSPPA